MTKKLKLYVWEDVLCSWTCGIMFALASDVEEARKLILEDYPFESQSMIDDLNKEPAVFTGPVGFHCYGSD